MRGLYGSMGPQCFSFRALWDSVESWRTELKVGAEPLAPHLKPIPTSGCCAMLCGAVRPSTLMYGPGMHQPPQPQLWQQHSHHGGFQGGSRPHTSQPTADHHGTGQRPGQHANGPTTSQHDATGQRSTAPEQQFVPTQVTQLFTLSSHFTVAFRPLFAEH